MGVVKPVNRGPKRGMSIRQRRIAQLRQRLDVEQDPKVREIIKAQLAHFARQTQQS